MNARGRGRGGKPPPLQSRKTKEAPSEQELQKFFQDVLQFLNKMEEQQMSPAQKKAATDLTAFVAKYKYEDSERKETFKEQNASQMHLISNDSFEENYYDNENDGPNQSLDKSLSFEDYGEEYDDDSFPPVKPPLPLPRKPSTTSTHDKKQLLQLPPAKKTSAVKNPEYRKPSVDVYDDMDDEEPPPLKPPPTKPKRPAQPEEDYDDLDVEEGITRNESVRAASIDPSMTSAVILNSLADQKGWLNKREGYFNLRTKRCNFESF